MKVELLTVLPVYIVKSVDIRLVNLLITLLCNTCKGVVLGIIDKCLSACDGYNITVCACLSVGIIGISYRNLFGRYIDDIGKLIDKYVSSVTKLIRISTAHLKDVDLLVDGSNLGCD